MTDPLTAEESQPLLLILDGLDELSKSGHVGAEIVRGLVSESQSLLKSTNNGCSRPKLLILLCGRPVAVDAIKGLVRRGSDVINLLPFIVNKEEIKISTEGHAVTVQDPAHLLAVDQRAEWWQRYGEATGKDGIALYQQIAAKDRLVPVTSQPMLNYLVAFLQHEGKWSEPPENLCDLYRQLLQKIYERVWEDERVPASTGLTEAQFAELLGEIAYAAWHGGNTRTIRVSAVEAILSDQQKQWLKQLEDTIEKGVLRLLFAFFVRPQSYDDHGRTYEFTHKKFSEYLVAQRLFRKATEFVQQERRREGEKDPHRELLKRWAQVFGPSALGEISQFIRDGAKSTQADVRKVQQLMVRLLRTVIADGMPMQDLIAECKTFREMVRQGKNAEFALLVFHSACGYATNRASDRIRFDNENSLQDWIFSQVYPSYRWYDAMMQMNHFDLTGCLIPYGGPHADFTGSILDHGSFSQFHVSSYFDNCSLVGTDLSNAEFGGSSFLDANMSGAIITGTVFSDSKVTLAQLRTTVGNPARMPDGKPPWPNWRTRKPPKTRETSWTRA